MANVCILHKLKSFSAVTPLILTECFICVKTEEWQNDHACFSDCASVFARILTQYHILGSVRSSISLYLEPVGAKNIGSCWIVTYIFLRHIPKWMLSLSRCLKHSPLLPSPSSLTVSSSQSSSLLHHLQRAFYHGEIFYR